MDQPALAGLVTRDSRLGNPARPWDDPTHGRRLLDPLPAAGDTYGVAIEPGQDVVLLLAAAVTIDELSDREQDDR